MKLKLQPTRIFNWLLIGLNTNSSNYTAKCNSHSVALYLKIY